MKKYLYWSILAYAFFFGTPNLFSEIYNLVIPKAKAFDTMSEMENKGLKLIRIENLDYDSAGFILVVYTSGNPNPYAREP